MLKRVLAGVALVACTQAASAAVVYSNWTSNEGHSGNYLVAVSENAGKLDFAITVDPWNAEMLGLFVNLGAVDVGTLTLSNVNPAGQVAVVGTDTTSDSCGNGCNLNGLNVPEMTGDDGEWEMVFRLGQQGFDGIQSFSFTVASSSLALTEDMLGIIGVRAQQLCDPGSLLPDANCGGSDKAWGFPDAPGQTIPVPGSAALLGLGLAGLGLVRRRKS